MASSAFRINGGHNSDAHDTQDRVLMMDDAPRRWFHLKLCMVAGVGFFADAYDLFVINIASTILNYGPELNEKLTPDQDFYLKVAAPIGMIFGALVFGLLADHLGRRRMYGTELIIMIIATFAQALSGATTTFDLIAALVIWRIIVGIGIGGDYPLSAIIVSEYSPKEIRGRLMTSVVACQGWGNLAASLVALVIVAASNASLAPSIPSITLPINNMWRLLIGLGCVPAAIGLFFRLTVPETPRFTADIKRNIDQAREDINTCYGKERGEGFIRPTTVPKASLDDFIEYFRKWDNFKVLFGVCYSWFAIDVSFYGLGLNSSIILKQVKSRFSESEPDVYHTLYSACVFNVIMAVAGLIPGYWATFVFIDKWGRKPIQFMGFTILAILFIITGAVFDDLTKNGEGGTNVLVVLYCLANFFQNFGPNTTTFIIPGELFPTRYRSTCHGIATASGKLGATVSLIMFHFIQKDIGSTRHLLTILGCFMLTGIVSTYWLPETKGKSLEELSNEGQAVQQGHVQGHTGHAIRMVPMEA